jgi:hypothetical protein
VTPWRQVGAHSVADGINAVRLILPRAWFDAERCAGGIKALRNYRREWNENAQTWRSSPVHDFASHGADAARYLALGVRESSARAEFDPPAHMQFESARMTTGWMAS